MEQKKEVKKGTLFKLPFLKNIDKKKLQIAAAIVLIVVILIIYFSSFSGGTSADTDSSEAKTVNAKDYCERVQQDLSSFLSKIKGAGRVEVLVNFENSVELMIAYITNESSGQNTSQSSSSPVILTQNGVQVPLILKEIHPKVIGVIVAAEGADTVSVKLSLIDAVRTYFNIASSLVQVYTLKK